MFVIKARNVVLETCEQLCSSYLGKFWNNLSLASFAHSKYSSHYHLRVVPERVGIGWS